MNRGDILSNPSGGTIPLNEEMRCREEAAIGQGEAAKDWERCARIMQEHSDQMVRRWQEEIDMLLVWAGLFSAVLTAFSVEAYPLLQPDQGDELLLALAAIAVHLQGSPHGSPPLASRTNCSEPLARHGSFKAPAYAVWLNALWFSALACTLFASSVAITVRQWLRQYGTDVWGNSRETIRVRQYRYDNLHRWHVPGIVTFLPVILQLALVLFLAGLLVLLWSLHRTVAIIISTFVISALILMAVATVLPTVRADCPYQSPQARCFSLSLRLLVSFAGCLVKAMYGIILGAQRRTQNQTIIRAAAVMTTWLSCRRSHLERWADSSSWEAREGSYVRAMSPDIDLSLLRRVYLITLDRVLLTTEVKRCLQDFPPMSMLWGAFNMLCTNADSENLWDDAWGARDCDSPRGHRHATKARTTHFYVFLLNEVLVSLPHCIDMLETLRQVEKRRLATSILELLPPKIHSKGRAHTFYHTTIPKIPPATVLRALAALVCRGFSPTDCFYRLAIHINALKLARDSSLGSGTFEAEDLEVVVTAFPKTVESWNTVMEWDNSLMVHEVFPAMNTMIHVVRELLFPDDTDCARKLLQDILASIESFLSHPSWQLSVDRQRLALNTICLVNGHPETADHPAFLPTVSQLVLDESTRGLIPISWVKLLQQIQSIIDYGLTRGWLSSEDISTMQYNALSQTIHCLEDVLGGRRRTAEVPDDIGIRSSNSLGNHVISGIPV